MLRNHRWFPITLAALAIAVAHPGAALSRTLGVEVWTDRGDDAVYQPGDLMQVKVRSSDDAYLLVYQVDSDGRVSVLFPWRKGPGLVEGRRTYRMPPERSGYELAVEKSTGEGFIIAIASRRPFRDLPWYLRPFDPQGDAVGYEDRNDDEEGVDDEGRIVGDPMVAMERVRRRVLDRPSDTDDFATSYASYYVGHEVRYPRYLCADCHRPGRWAWWDGFDPYYSRCSVFDFRVNWNWCWGPCIWTGRVPYFYYVVRPDCPPHYRGWYNDRSRWSAWDGYDRWTSLWGGSITRYKPEPPPQQTAPPPVYKPGSGTPGTLPPGYLPPASGGTRRGGFSAPVPIGHIRGEGEGSNSYGRGERGNGNVAPPRLTPPERPRGDSQRPARDPKLMPSQRPPREESPRQAPQVDEPRQRPQQTPPRQAPQVDEPRQRPQQTPPRQAPQVDEPRQRPQQPPPRQEQPQRVDPPRREPERQAAPRSEPQQERKPREDGNRGRGGNGR